MARVNMKANGAEEAGSGFPPIPEGEYYLVVKKVTDGIVASSGRQKANLEFEVGTGPYEGRKIWHTLTFIPEGDAGHGLMVQALKALNMPHDGELDFDSQELLGKVCRAKVIIATYEGKKNNKIDVAGFLTDFDGEGKPAAPQAKTPPVERQPAAAGARASAPASTGKVPF